MSRKPQKRRIQKTRKSQASQSRQVALADVLAEAVRLHGSGQLSKAEEIYRQILKHKPGQVDALHCLGLVAFQKKEFARAERLIQQAIAGSPNTPAFYCNLGQVYRNQGKIKAAIEQYRKAIELQPDYAEALNHLGGVLYEQGDIPGAIAACSEAVECQPNYADAHCNLGGALARQGQLDTAISHYETAINLNPGLVEAYHNLGNALFRQGDIEQARHRYSQAIQLRPDDGLKIKMATLLPTIYQTEEEIHQCRKRLESELDALLQQPLSIQNPIAQAGMANFYLVYQGKDDRAIQEKLATLYRSAWKGAREEPEFAPPGDKIKVGFVSAHFHDHTIGKLMHGVIVNLSREKFSTVVFSIEHRNDGLGDLIRRAADSFFSLPNRIEEASRRIAEEKVDVLFYADIGMHPMTYFLAFSRLAPVQCVTWGHPVTTGLDMIDYFVATEDLESEQGERFYSEELVRLPSTPTYYHQPNVPFPLKDRAKYGMADEWNVYACPQSLFKFHPGFDAALAGILRGDPAARLVLIANEQNQWKAMLRQRFEAVMPDVCARIIFLPYLEESDFLNLIAVSDVMLDTWPFGGGNTSYEAFGMGVPVVTLPTDMLRGRITYALCKAMDLQECIASSMENYIEIALKLGTGVAFREGVKKKILQNRQSIFEDANMVRQLEQFLIRAVEEGQS